MPLKNKKIIVTGGPTREWIDAVRFLSNPSSGKMGIAIADEAYLRSKDVVFIHGTIDKAILKNKTYKTISFETTVDLLKAVLQELTPNSLLIMAAAPADYTPFERCKSKIKKDCNELTIRLKKNPDILKEVAKIRKSNYLLKNMFVVGFAAETEELEVYAFKKLKEKDLDMICLNDVSRKDAGFGVDMNIITIIKKNGSKVQLPLLSKREIANNILDQIEAELYNNLSIVQTVY